MDKGLVCGDGENNRAMEENDDRVMTVTRGHWNPDLVNALAFLELVKCGC